MNSARLAPVKDMDATLPKLALIDSSLPFDISLAFSVTLFCSTAMLALIVMMMRRSKIIGGELGGPRGYKIATSSLFVFLWLFYVFMSSLEAYGYIEGKSTHYLFIELLYKMVPNSFSNRFLNRSTRNTQKQDDLIFPGT